MSNDDVGSEIARKIKKGTTDENGMVRCLICGKTDNRAKQVRQGHKKIVLLYNSPIRRVKTASMDGYAHEECLKKCQK